MTLIDLLNQRRSVPSRQLVEPAPDDDALETILQAAIRVPDHGKLVPWRIVAVRGAQRAGLAEALARIHARNEPDVAPKALDKDRERFGGSPLILVVVARIDAGHAKVPAQEQWSSAACVAYNLLLGAQALGFGAQWLTGWAAYDRDAAAALGLAANESVVGFVHVGSIEEPAPERTRPALADVFSDWRADA